MFTPYWASSIGEEQEPVARLLHLVFEVLENRGPRHRDRGLEPPRSLLEISLGPSSSSRYRRFEVWEFGIRGNKISWYNIQQTEEDEAKKTKNLKWVVTMSLAACKQLASMRLAQDKQSQQVLRAATHGVIASQQCLVFHSVICLQGTDMYAILLHSEMWPWQPSLIISCFRNTLNVVNYCSTSLFFS